MPFRSFYNLFHIDDSRDLCLHPACSPSFLWCPLGHFLSALLLLPEATCECGGSFPPGTALQFPKVPHQTQSYLQGSFPPSGLLPTSWLRKEVLGEALAACYSLFILSNLQIRISILVHTENDLPSFLSFCILIFPIRAGLAWEHQSGCSPRAVRAPARRMLGGRAAWASGGRL